MNDTPWLLFVVIGLLTFTIRFTPIAIAGRGLPPLLLRALRYVPPAVLAAIFVPELLMPKGAVDISLANGRLLAGIIAIGIAWRTKNVLLTVIAGMVALWILTLISMAN